MKKILIFILLSFLLTFGATPAYAVPALPHAFYGSVTINGTAAPDGSRVSATVDSGTIVSTQNPVTTVAGSYGIDSSKLLVQGDDLSGATITFYVNGVSTGQTDTFEAGGGPTTLDLSVTIAPPPPPAPPLEPPVLPRGTTDVRGMVGTGCRFTESVPATSDDELCTLTIPEGTVGLTEDLECITEITMVTMDDPPPPPEEAHVIGLVYDFGPDGATFEDAIILTFTYDPDSLPEGVSEEDLVIAYFIDGEWIELEGVVDTETKTVTASVSHFTTFALIGTPPTVVEEEPPVVKEEPVVAEKEEEPVVEEEPSVVEEEVEPAPVEEEVEVTPEPAAGINWPVVGGIIGGVVLLVGWLIFLFWRRRAYN